MSRRWNGALAGTLAMWSVLAACQPAPAPPADPAILRVEGGSLRGVVSDTAVEFRGIPYAAAPIGERRFAPPAPPEPWAGTRDATRFAATCPQFQSTDEDCLYLNVTRPRETGGEALPTMVWLHGGGFSSGTPNNYDARELAARGRVVVVGVEFRVNVFGLFALPGMAGSGAQIFLDQQAALQWVKRNIGAFGGDPGNVTVFGESGGAIGICAQLASPRARGLFHKAILQSGTCSTSFAANFVARGVPAGGYFIPLGAAEAQGLALARAVGCEAPEPAQMLACLRRLPAATIAEAGGAFYSAAFGTPTLPADPQRALDSGSTAPVPVLTGFTQQEGLAMVGGMALTSTPVTPADHPRLIGEAFPGRARDVAARYPLSQHAGRGDLAWAAIVTDRMFACAQLRDAGLLARRAPVYAYEFADPDGAGLVPVPPGLPKGPSHSSELPLLFRLTDGPIDLATGQRIERSSAQQRLSERLIDFWSSFARTGRPVGLDGEAWPRFAADQPRSTKWLTTAGGPEPASDAATAHQCAFWTPFLLR